MEKANSNIRMGSKWIKIVFQGIWTSGTIIEPRLTGLIVLLCFSIGFLFLFFCVNSMIFINYEYIFFFYDTNVFFNRRFMINILRVREYSILIIQ